MGKIKEAVQEWLEDYGYDLDYDMSNYPDIKDFKWIANNKVKSTVYYSHKDAMKQNDLAIKHGAPEPPEVFDDE
tara:strand:+ start:361 stop:582 length:222 start_codon:yes stop_codon:yes gene_type:complete